MRATCGRRARLTALIAAWMAVGACTQLDLDESELEQAVLDPPTIVTATPTSPSRITVSWSAVPGAIKYYVVQSIGSAGPYTFKGTTLSPGTSLPVANLQPGTEYCYRVATEDGTGP